MSVVGNQRQIYLRLADELRQHWHSDRAFPQRLQTLLTRQRSFGSSDRRLYRELLYTTVRFAPWIEPLLDRDSDHAAAAAAWLSSESAASRAYRSVLTAGWPDCPPAVADKATVLQQTADCLLPEWLRDECPQAFAAPEIDALHRRASLWLRAQTDDFGPIIREFATRGWEARPGPLLPEAIEVLADANVTESAAYQRGLFEIQDLGSQLILATAKLPAGGHWLDACAGAGGKTLQLRRILGSAGRIDAHDIRPAVLAELGRRSARAGFTDINLLNSIPSVPYDGVLVDAPCSGSGTWRRSPHLKWMTTAETVTQHAARQLMLLSRYAALVRSGGWLIYATCSLARTENTGVVSAFLANHPDFALVPPSCNFGYESSPQGLAILPSRHNTDGFYVATMHRR